MPEWFKLFGIAIVVAGLALRLRPTLVVVTAALVTGLLAGMPLFSSAGVFEGVPHLTRPGQEGVINMLGRAFADNRLMTLFIITLPAIGFAERYGLQEQSGRLIKKVRAATVGRLALVYQLFRVVQGLMGIRLNGHPAFVRPLVYPMAVGAAQTQAQAGSADDLPTEKVEEIKAANSAAENYGNFYGQNLSPVQPGVLLVFGVMAGLGYTVSVWSLVLYTLPIVAASVILAAIQFLLIDRRYKQEAGGRKGPPPDATPELDEKVVSA